MRRFTTRARWPSLAIALLLILIAAPALSQTWPRREVQGVVTDSATGQPIVGAWVQVADGGDGAYTNGDGRFRLHDVRIGTVAFEAGQLGYADFAEERAIGDDDAELRITLAPDPVVLEGIRVISDRLASRRNAVPYSVRAFDTDNIMRSGAFDAFDFVRLNAFTRPCGPSTCIYRRGRVVRPTVYIDEAPHLGGLDNLRGLPVEHLYLVEVIGTQVRVYTKHFAERLATRGAPLMPMLVSW